MINKKKNTRGGGGGGGGVGVTHCQQTWLLQIEILLYLLETLTNKNYIPTLSPRALAEPGAV